MEKKFKVVRIDNNGASAVMIEEQKELEMVDAVLEGYDCVTDEEIIKAAKDADVIITIEAIISRNIMENLPKLKAVIRYGVGYDTVDLEAATDNNIMVVNIPDFCWEEVSNHVMMFILVHSKKMIMMNKMVKAGQWGEAKKALAPMAAIHGETLGIIGCGRIGRTVAEKAKSFNMNIIGYDKYLPNDIAEKAGITLVSLEELLKNSDYITVHTALTPETKHMISVDQFNMMKSTAIIINTSRGPVIDENAMIKALQEKVIAGAGLDVFEQEPIDPTNPLLKIESAITLPHSASYSDAAFSRLRTSVGKEAARIARGEVPKSLLNKEVTPK